RRRQDPRDPDHPHAARREPDAHEARRPDPPNPAGLDRCAGGPAERRRSEDHARFRRTRPAPVLEGKGDIGVRCEKGERQDTAQEHGCRQPRGRPERARRGQSPEGEEPHDDAEHHERQTRQHPPDRNVGNRRDGARSEPLEDPASHEDRHRRCKPADEQPGREQAEAENERPDEPAPIDERAGDNDADEAAEKEPREDPAVEIAIVGELLRDDRHDRRDGKGLRGDDRDVEYEPDGQGTSTRRPESGVFGHVPRMPGRREIRSGMGAASRCVRPSLDQSGLRRPGVTSIGSASGSAKPNSEPPPSRGRAQIRPPWTSSIRRQTARPTPIPLVYRLASSVRKKATNNRSGSMSPRPMPRSSTITLASLSSHWTSTSISVEAGLYFAALLRRFSSSSSR